MISDNGSVGIDVDSDTATLSSEEREGRIKEINNELAGIDRSLMENDRRLNQSGSDWRQQTDDSDVDSTTTKLSARQAALMAERDKLWDQRAASPFVQAANRFERTTPVTMPSPEPARLEPETPTELNPEKQIAEYSLPETIAAYKKILENVEANSVNLGKEMATIEQQIQSNEENVEIAKTMLRQARREYEQMLTPNLRPENNAGMSLEDIAKHAQAKLQDISKKIPEYARDIQTSENFIEEYQRDLLEAKSALEAIRDRLQRYQKVKDEAQKEIA
ncbi:MAG: hypothetical protein NTW50_01155 [Candidatus Berkelbacteria bacterium]|nr:hypothetical protein [Candidatus Berkelbacteria bacterium]